MNKNEIKLASVLVKELESKFYCPHCSNKLSQSAMVPMQVRCDGCLLKMTIYVDEGASRIFDKQRQVEKPVAVRPVTNKELEELNQSAKKPKLNVIQESALEMVRDFRRRGRNVSKKQESQRKPKRAKDQKASRKLAVQGVQKRRQSR